MRLLIDVVIAFVGYQFGCWVKEADLVMAHFDDRNEIERLREKVAELEDEIRQHEAEEGTVVWQ